MTDNRTNEPTEAQVEAAAKAIWERYAGHGLWTTLPEARKSPFLKDARAALVAAQGAAPQAESEACGNTIAPIGDGRRWGACAKPLGHEPTCAPVLPSSGVDEDALAEALSEHVLGEPNGGTSSWSWCKCSCGFEVRREGVTRDYVEKLARKHQARAVVEAIGGESR